MIDIAFFRCVHQFRWKWNFGILLALTFIASGCAHTENHNHTNVGDQDITIQNVNHHYYEELLRSTDRFLNALSSEQRSQLVKTFDDPYRTRGFCYVLAHCKNDAVGLKMQDLNAQQKTALHSLLMKLLSSAGYAKAIQTMNREWLIQEMEDAHRENPKAYPAVGSKHVPNWKPPMKRGGANFYIALFGEPSPSNPWGLRFEGHHLSLNYTFGNHEGKLAIGFAPIFYGSSPMTVPASPSHGSGEKYKLWKIQEGQQLLRRESWLARSFLSSLKDAQRTQGKWDRLPGAELMGGTATPLKNTEGYLENQSQGIMIDQLNDVQKTLLLNFIDSFAHSPQIGIPSHINMQQALRGGKIWWYGNWSKEDEPFYFRVQSSRYLVEILQSNTFGVESEIQANHVHAAFRDLASDWDYNVLQEHLNHSH